MCGIESPTRTVSAGGAGGGGGRANHYAMIGVKRRKQILLPVRKWIGLDLLYFTLCPPAGSDIQVR